jgi:hypothetical protein
MKAIHSSETYVLTILIWYDIEEDFIMDVVCVSEIARHELVKIQL